MNQSRITFIDVFRGFGILLMVMGHIGFGGIFDKFIHAFHMPMFFFVSGYFYHRKVTSLYDYCKKGKVSADSICNNWNYLFHCLVDFSL